MILVQNQPNQLDSTLICTNELQKNRFNSRQFVGRSTLLSIVMMRSQELIFDKIGWGLNESLSHDTAPICLDLILLRVLSIRIGKRDSTWASKTGSERDPRNWSCILSLIIPKNYTLNDNYQSGKCIPTVVNGSANTASLIWFINRSFMIDRLSRHMCTYEMIQILYLWYNGI